MLTPPCPEEYPQLAPWRSHALYVQFMLTACYLLSNHLGLIFPASCRSWGRGCASVACILRAQQQAALSIRTLSYVSAVARPDTQAFAPRDPHSTAAG